MRTLLVAALTTILFCTPLVADEKLKGIACRSVHLGYPASDGVVFYNEVTVDRSAPGTYFCVCGWSKGYFGIQELANGKKLAIFSVWDSAQNDPKAVKDEERVKLLHKDEKVRIGRFGGEGTGGQSFYDFDWKIGQTLAFVVTAKVDGQRTEYAGWLRESDTSEWRHLVTFSTITGGAYLKGYYSFVEDFRRNRESTKFAREARFGNGWVLTTKGENVSLTNARFTADANPVTNINAGLKHDRFFLVTGGETENTDTKLKDTIARPANAARPPIPKLPPGVGAVAKP
jgi:Domain of unknown function (DUF3472)/Domain of unknown function (DUF5077)